MYQKITRILLPTFLLLTATLAGCLDSITPPSQGDIGNEETLVIAYEVKDDYDNPDENPQVLADYLANKLDMEVSLYPISSEGAIIEALRFGHADIAFMDGAAAFLATCVAGTVINSTACCHTCKDLEAQRHSLSRHKAMNHEPLSQPAVLKRSTSVLNAANLAVSLTKKV